MSNLRKGKMLNPVYLYSPRIFIIIVWSVCVFPQFLFVQFFEKTIGRRAKETGHKESSISKLVTSKSAYRILNYIT